MCLLASISACATYVVAVTGTARTVLGVFVLQSWFGQLGHRAINCHRDLSLQTRNGARTLSGVEAEIPG